MTTFGQRMTLEEFKSANKCSALFFNYATKVAITNEANETLGWCSREVAAEIAEGKPIASDPRGLAIVDVITDDGVAHPTLLHPSTSNRIEGLTL